MLLCTKMNNFAVAVSNKHTSVTFKRAARQEKTYAQAAKERPK